MLLPGAMLHLKYAKRADKIAITLNNNRSSDSSDIFIWYDPSRKAFDVWLNKWQDFLW